MGSAYYVSCGHSWWKLPGLTCAVCPHHHLEGALDGEKVVFVFLVAFMNWLGLPATVAVLESPVCPERGWVGRNVVQGNEWMNEGYESDILPNSEKMRPDMASTCQFLSSQGKAGDWNCTSSFSSVPLVALDNVFGLGETQSTHLWNGAIVPIMRAGQGNGMKMTKWPAVAEPAGLEANRAGALEMSKLDLTDHSPYDNNKLREVCG